MVKAGTVGNVRVIDYVETPYRPIKIDETLKKSLVSGVDIVTTCVLPLSPSEFLLHKRFVNLLKVLSSQYEHVVVDCAPILASTDANIMGQLVGATLMALKAGAHPMREIELSVKRLKQANVNLRGLLLNDVNVSSRRYGAGKYSYMYSYKKCD